MQLLRWLILAEKQNACLAICPLEMRIADLVVTARYSFARRFVSAFDETAIGDEIADFGKAMDVFDLVQDDQ